MPDVSEGCDVEIVHFTLAHDRYGGRPIIGRAQILHNARDVGIPPIIIATPPLEEGAGLGPDQDAETERHAERMVGIALDAWVRSLESEEDDVATPCCLIHLQAAGLDFGPMDAILRGLANAIRPYLSCD